MARRAYWSNELTPEVAAVMGNACSGQDDDVLATLDTDTRQHLQREFNEVDFCHVGWISRQQFEAILLKRAYDARTSASLEYQIGGNLEKSYAYRGKAVTADRSLVRAATLVAFAAADPSNSGRIDFAGFVRWQLPTCSKRAGPSTKLCPPVQGLPLRSLGSVSVYSG